MLSGEHVLPGETNSVPVYSWYIFSHASFIFLRKNHVGDSSHVETVRTVSGWESGLAGSCHPATVAPYGLAT